MTDIWMLAEALRPFVAAHEKTAWEFSDSDLYNEQPRTVTLTLGDFRRARSVLAQYDRDECAKARGDV